MVYFNIRKKCLRATFSGFRTPANEIQLLTIVVNALLSKYQSHKKASKDDYELTRPSRFTSFYNTSGKYLAGIKTKIKYFEMFSTVYSNLLVTQ